MTGESPTQRQEKFDQNRNRDIIFETTFKSTHYCFVLRVLANIHFELLSVQKVEKL